MKLKDLLMEAKRPDYKLVLPPKKNLTKRLMDTIKSKRSSILSSVKKRDNIMDACYVLNKAVKGYPVKVYFAIAEEDEFLGKGDKDKSPFSYGEQVSDGSTFYDENPHIIFYLTQYFFEYMEKKDYVTLYGFFHRTFTHELIHVNQHKEFGDELIEYFSNFSMKEFIKLHVDGGLNKTISQLRKNPSKVNKKDRGIIANQYLLNPVELPAYAYTLVAELTVSLQADDKDMGIDEMKDVIGDMIDNEKGFSKSKTFSLFNKFINWEYEAKYKKFLSMAKEYLAKLDDSYFDRYK